jgi:hypothetical protein
MPRMFRVVSRAAARWLSTGASNPLSVAEVKGWGTARVLEFAKSIGLDDDDATVLSANKITGKNLLSLTEDDLRADGMPRGPANNLATAIAGLRDKGELPAGTWWSCVQGSSSVSAGAPMPIAPLPSPSFAARASQRRSSR